MGKLVHRLQICGRGIYAGFDSGDGVHVGVRMYLKLRRAVPFLPSQLAGENDGDLRHVNARALYIDSLEEDHVDPHASRLTVISGSVP